MPWLAAALSDCICTAWLHLHCHVSSLRRADATVQHGHGSMKHMAAGLWLHSVLLVPDQASVVGLGLVSLVCGGMGFEVVCA